MGNFWDDAKKVGGAIAGAGAGIALGGPLGVPGAVAALGGGAAGASDAGQKAIDEAAKGLQTAAEAGGKIAEGIGEVIITVAEKAIEFVKSLIPGAIGIRPLRGSERVLADRVFNVNKETVQLDRIRIVSVYGLQARPFVMPGIMLPTVGLKIPAIGPCLAWTSIVTGLANKYLIFFGAAGFNDSLNFKLESTFDGKTVVPGQKLIHELTHVWQGQNNLFGPSYMVESVWNQCKCGIAGGSAYSYTTGQQWSQYNPEQQASIVEHWFRDTKQATDITLDPARLPYIATNIRTGSINAQYLNMGVVASGLTKVPDGTSGVPNALDRVGGLTKMLDARSVGPTMTQLLDVLDTLKPQRTALMPYRHQIAIQAQIYTLDAQIAAYEGMVRAMVAQGALIEDRARFAISMGAGPRISATSTSRPSPILRR